MKLDYAKAMSNIASAVKKIRPKVDYYFKVKGDKFDAKQDLKSIIALSGENPNAQVCLEINVAGYSTTGYFAIYGSDIMFDFGYDSVVFNDDMESNIFCFNYASEFFTAGIYKSDDGDTSIVFQRSGRLDDSDDATDFVESCIEQFYKLSTFGDDSFSNILGMMT